jgi:thymidylate kinase
MFTVALIGADGAGKTTIARRLEAEGNLPIRYLYMGANPQGGAVLPTTRLVTGLRRLMGRPAHQGGPPDPAHRAAQRRGGVRGALRAIRSSLRLLNQIAEEWVRAALAWRLRRRGYIVLYDRHYCADHWAHDVANPGRSALRRLHGLLLRRAYPRPDLVIVLDAPAAVLYRRKREGTVELIERRRREYLEYCAGLSNVAIIRADRALDEVAREVLDAIRRFGPRAAPRKEARA